LPGSSADESDTWWSLRHSSVAAAVSVLLRNAPREMRRATRGNDCETKLCIGRTEFDRYEDSIDSEESPAVADNASMAYDEDLANRVRELVADIEVTEKRMFGGLTFLINGNMSVTVSRKGGLMLRCAPDASEELRSRRHAGPIEMRGRVMDGWVWVELEGLRTKRQLEPWVARAVAYTQSLPPKG